MENGICGIAVHPCVSFIRVRQAFQLADNACRTRMRFTHGSRPNTRTCLCHPHSKSLIAPVQPLLQRHLGSGYGRAARLIDDMAADGIVGDDNGSQAREVLRNLDQWGAIKASRVPMDAAV